MMRFFYESSVWFKSINRSVEIATHDKVIEGVDDGELTKTSKKNK